MILNIAANTVFGDLQDPRLEGYVLSVRLDRNRHVLGRAKQAIYLTGASQIVYDTLPWLSGKHIWLQTEHDVFCIDDPIEIKDFCPEERRNKLFVHASRISENNSKNLNQPVCQVWMGSDSLWGHQPHILGPCIVLCDHTHSPKLWIETNSEIVLDKSINV